MKCRTLCPESTPAKVFSKPQLQVEVLWRNIREVVVLKAMAGVERAMVVGTIKAITRGEVELLEAVVGAKGMEQSRRQIKGPTYCIWNTQAKTL